MYSTSNFIKDFNIASNTRSLRTFLKSETRSRVLSSSFLTKRLGLLSKCSSIDYKVILHHQFGHSLSHFIVTTGIFIVLFASKMSFTLSVVRVCALGTVSYQTSLHLNEHTDAQKLTKTSLEPQRNFKSAPLCIHTKQLREARSGMNWTTCFKHSIGIHCERNIKQLEPCENDTFVVVS